MENRSRQIYVSDEFVRRPAGPVPHREDGTAAPRSRPRILVVDDQKLIVQTLAEILERAGFEVAAAYDGWEALDAAARFQPDHLLSDVLMPRMNGVELAIAVRKMYPTIKILLFSGQAGISELLLSAEERGFVFEVIPKPVHPRKLVERIKDQK
jgi:CheY-like chemotaxis protein